MATLRKPGFRLVSVVLAAVISASGLAACGSSSNNSSDSPGPTSKGNFEIPAAVKANAEKFLKKPTSIGITESLKALPTGKKVAWIGVGTANDIAAYNSFQKAAKTLGLQVKNMQAGSDVQKEVAAIEQAKAEGFDAIILSGLLTASIGPQLTAAHNAGIKVLGYSTSLEGTSSDNVDFSYYPLPEARRFAEIMADWVIQDSGGNANVLDVYPPDIKAGAAQGTTFAEELKKNCPGCKVKNLEFNISEVGTALPARIVSAVQANPGVNYILGTFGAVFIGVPEALKASGLNQKIRGVTIGGTSANMQQILNNQVLVASLDQGLEYRGYMLADAISRMFAGQEVPADTYEGFDMPVQIHTKDTIDFDPAVNWAGAPDDFVAQFEKLWSVK